MRQFLIIAALVVFAGIIWWLTDMSPVMTDQEDTISSDEPDIFGKNVTLVQFNFDGSLHYRLTASSIRQYSVEELTRMVQPKLHLTSADQPPWDVESEHGYIRKRTSPAGTLEDVVYLREDVRMVQDHPENGLVTLRSESFYIFPDRQYAETDQDVMIDTNVGRTKAGSLRADLESGRLELSSGQRLRVHTIVLPEQFKKS